MKSYECNPSQLNIEHGHRVITRLTGVTEIKMDLILNTVVYYNVCIINYRKQ